MKRSRWLAAGQAENEGPLRQPALAPRRKNGARVRHSAALARVVEARACWFDLQEFVKSHGMLKKATKRGTRG